MGNRLACWKIFGHLEWKLWCAVKPCGENPSWYVWLKECRQKRLQVQSQRGWKQDRSFSRSVGASFQNLKKFGVFGIHPYQLFGACVKEQTELPAGLRVRWKSHQCVTHCCCNSFLLYFSCFCVWWEITGKEMMTLHMNAFKCNSSITLLIVPCRNCTFVGKVEL